MRYVPVPMRAWKRGNLFVVLPGQIGSGPRRLTQARHLLMVLSARSVRVQSLLGRMSEPTFEIAAPPAGG